jgi:hypothetical protein
VLEIEKFDSRHAHEITNMNFKPSKNSNFLLNLLFVGDDNELPGVSCFFVALATTLIGWVGQK